MKLSIVVPVYNTEAYLEKCLDSLLGPELSDYEIIAVNDGSTDGSGEILETYCARFPERIHPVTTPNGGLGHARNTGLALAKGEYVLFVDSDDYLSPHAVAEILDTAEDMRRADCTLAVFDFVHVSEEGAVTASFRGCEKDRIFTLRDFPEFLFFPHNAVNKIWRRDTFMESGIRFPDRLYYEDLATVPKLYLHTDRILPVHRPWYCYLQRQGSITNALRVDRNEEMIPVVRSVLDYYRETGAFDTYAKQLEYKFFYEEALASVTRVNLIDPASGIQERLRDDFLGHFPDYRENPYFLAAPKKYRLLERLIRRGDWKAVHLLMSLNNKVKGR